MKKIWKDINIMRIVLFITNLILIPFIIYDAYKKNLGGGNPILLLAYLFAFLLCGLIFINSIRTKLTYVTNEGIRIGNAPDDKYQHIKLTKKALFIKWDEINSIKIVRHEVRRMAWFDLINYLVIKTKGGKVYESFIAKPNGFIKNVKDLKKDYLFSKDSKYIDN